MPPGSPPAGTPSWITSARTSTAKRSRTASSSSSASISKNFRSTHPAIEPQCGRGFRYTERREGPLSFSQARPPGVEGPLIDIDQHFNEISATWRTAQLPPDRRLVLHDDDQGERHLYFGDQR